MEKKCNVCLKVLPIGMFVSHPSTADRRQNQCTPCRNLVQIKYRNTKKGHSRSIVYEKTKKGFLVRSYRNMLSRVTGVQSKGNYLGLDILEKGTFYEWALSDKEFNRIFELWELKGYERMLSPSVDRVNSNKGYTLDNMRWLTNKENSILGNISRWNKYKYNNGGTL